MSNKIIDFFESNIKGKSFGEEGQQEFVNLLKESSRQSILESSKIVGIIPCGTPILLETYKKGGLDEEIIKEQLANLNGMLEEFTAHNYPEEDHINSVLECINYLNTADVIMGSREYIYTKAKEQFTAKLENIDRTIVLEGSNIDMDEEAVMETIMARTQAEFDIAFTEAFLSSDENFTMESVNELIRLSNRHDVVLNDMIALEAKNGINSSGQSGIRKAAVKLDDKSRQAANKIKTGGKNASAVVHTAKKAGGRFTSLVGSTLDKLNQMQKEERLEAVLQGGMRRRASTLIRTAIMSGAVWAINPALGMITLLTSATLHRRSDQRLKQEMIREYEGELKLVREKIRDAESAGDRKTKYNLMRIENHLEQSIERVKSPFRMNKSKVRKG